MGIYACPRCGNPNGWWSGNMRDVHDCPGPPRRQWPQRPEYPPQLDWSEVDGTDTSGVAACPAPNVTREQLQRWHDYMGFLMEKAGIESSEVIADLYYAYAAAPPGVQEVGRG